MARVAKATLVLEGDNKRLKRSLRGARRETRSTAKRIRRSAKRIGQAIAAGLAVGGAAIASFTKSVVSVGDTVEQARIKLDSLFGSVDAGGEAFRRVREVAATLPFTFQKVLTSAQSLASIVEGPMEMEKRLRQIAELAARFPISMREATSNFIRFSQAGAAAADLFRDAGINAALGIQAGMSVSAEQSMKLWDNFFSRIEKSGTAATDRLAKSFTGIVSMLQDLWFDFRSRIAEAGVFESVKNALEGIRQRIRDMAESGALDRIARAFSDAITPAIEGAANQAQRLLDALERNPEALGDATQDFLEFGSVIMKIGSGIAQTFISVGKIIGDAFSILDAGVRSGLAQARLAFLTWKRKLFRDINKVVEVWNRVPWFAEVEPVGLNSINQEIRRQRDLIREYKFQAEAAFSDVGKQASNVAGIFSDTSTQIERATRKVQTFAESVRQSFLPFQRGEGGFFQVPEGFGARGGGGPSGGGGGRGADGVAEREREFAKSLMDDLQVMEQLRDVSAEAASLLIDAGFGLVSSARQLPAARQRGMTAQARIARRLGGPLTVRTPTAVTGAAGIDTTRAEEAFADVSGKVDDSSDKFGALVNPLSNVIQKLVGFDSQLGKIIRTMSSAITGFLQGGPLGAVSGLLSGFAGFLQHGGTVGRGQWAIAGEAGPEVVRGPASVSPMPEGGGGGGGSRNFVAIPADALSRTTRHHLATDMEEQELFDRKIEENMRRGGALSEFRRRGER